MAKSVKEVEKLVRDAKPGNYPVGDGLYLRVAAGGSASWAFRYQLRGKRRWLGLGGYSTLKLKAAREQALEARLEVSRGVDPLAPEPDDTDERTFEQIAHEFIEERRHTWRNAKHAQQWENTLATYAYPVIGAKVPAEVTTEDVLAILRPIWTEKRETARRVRSRIEMVLNAARALGLTDKANPAQWKGHLDSILTDRRSPTVKHHAAMPYRDIPEFIEQVGASRSSLSSKALILTILCATRTSETLDATWDEFDLDAGVWTIPAHRMKGEREHRVPLSRQALALLNTLPSRDGYVFPGARKGRPLSNMAMTMVLRKLGYGHLTVHGFRSSFRDWVAEETEYDGAIAEMALAHVVANKVEAAYRRGDLLEKRRELAQDWADYTAG